ncbi:mechanosensitive ion channel domain-containing protein [Dysgonomonas macrotermitis]|uniref:Mechanosensitive ion channel n=1 Tax=Dysgonomonas macrotermitis TaxID=1346286 RepID=A0A1M4ZPA2_9BACT|nr:mechanosensitive ion channel domain-containing protein [Dysgonomonas macrotermitis]SHF19879.1 Mechanosensitive ion channel [Dysgonomonas macrotermitis]
MMDLINQHFIQVIATVLVLIATPVIRHLTKTVLRKYAVMKGKTENRTGQVVRLFAVIVNSLAVIILIVIWGVDPHNLLVAISSVFAVIGVALFAQWSMLSNITAGIIIFFTTPFKIGDSIRIVDKDIPFDAKVEDILAFHTHLRTKEGELVTYPNSLFFQKGVMILRIDTWNEETDE